MITWTGSATLLRRSRLKSRYNKTGCPVISNVSEREAVVVIAKAAYKRRSPLYDVSKIRYEIYEDTPFSQKVSMEIYEKRLQRR